MSIAGIYCGLRANAGLRICWNACPIPSVFFLNLNKKMMKIFGKISRSDNEIAFLLPTFIFTRLTTVSELFRLFCSDKHINLASYFDCFRYAALAAIILSGQ